MKNLSYFVVGLLIVSGFAAIGSVIGADDDTVNKQVDFLSPVLKDNNEFIDVEIVGANTYNYNSGEPMLPVHTETIELPFGVKNFVLSCEVNQVKTMSLDKKINPAPQLVAYGYDEIDTGPRMNPAIYDSDKIFPDDWFTYSVGVGLDENMQHKTFLTVNMFPVRYSPASDEISYVNRIDLKISYDDPEYNPFPATSDYDMVIICPEKFETDLQPLVEHKNNYGVKTMIKITEDIYSEYNGVDKPEQIKYFIKDALEELGVSYVLLVGGLNNKIYADPMDTENYGVKWWHVPVRWSNLDYDEPGPVSDLYYSDVYKTGGVFDDWNADGDDLIGEWKRFGGDRLDMYPDVALGRLACRNNDEVRSVVDKIINYESNAYNSDWFERYLGISGDGFLDQDDIGFAWDTNGLQNGAYTIYAQSNNDEGEFGPIEEINIELDKTKQTVLTFNHDDYLRVPNYPTYPAPPIAEISSISEGNIVGNTDYSYTPTESEAYCNRFTGWGDVEYKSGVLYLRGKTYDPKPYGNLTDIHVWVENSAGETVFDEWKYGFETFSEGDWTTGEKIQLGRAGALYYMPDDFESKLLWSSNGNWYGQDDVIEAISEGYGFVFFSGHGSPAVWANHYPGIPGNRQIADVRGLVVTDISESIIPTFPMKELSNDYELPVIVVGGCHNSMFTISMIPTFLNLYLDNNMHTYGLPTPECWAWYPVAQSKSGAIASIGNTGYGYGVLGGYCTVGGVDNWITTEFFVQYGTYGHDVLGEAYKETITSYIQNIGMGDEGDAKTLLQWVLLGDPSLKMGGYPPQQSLHINVAGDGFLPGDTVELRATGGSSYDWSIDKDGDGEFDTFATGQTIKEQWSQPGVYYVKAESSDGSTGLTVVEIENQVPDKPSITGPNSVESGKTYTYNIQGSDPDNDELYYLIEWGDGKYTVVMPGDSKTVTHSWSKTGPSIVKIKAIDSEGLYNEASISVTVPKTKSLTERLPLFTFIKNILEKYSNLFPLLRQIIEMV